MKHLDVLSSPNICDLNMFCLDGDYMTPAGGDEILFSFAQIQAML